MMNCEVCGREITDLHPFIVIEEQKKYFCDEGCYTIMENDQEGEDEDGRI